MFGSSRPAAPRDGRWLVVVLLLIVVLIPSATVLWLTAVAVRNERAAVKQHHRQSSEARLQLASSSVNDYWYSVEKKCRELSELHSGPALFRACVDADVADSVLVFDDDDTLVYPANPNVDTSATLNREAWQTANQLEFVERAYLDAAEAYAAIAEAELSPHLEANAWMAYARCLDRGGQRDEAIRAFTDRFNLPRLRHAVDRDGRVFWVDARLRALEISLTAEKDSAHNERLMQELRQALDDYSNNIPSAQRIFAMQRVQTLIPDEHEFTTLDAERLAAAHRTRAQQADDENAVMVRHDDTWCFAVPDSQVVLLFRHESLRRRLNGIVTAWNTDDVRINVAEPASITDDSSVLATAPLERVPEWHLSLESSGANPFAEASERQSQLYTLAGLMTIGVVTLGAVCIAGFVRRQLRVARLKSDRAALVTHELRTPLASIRVLVDTLLDGDVDEDRKTEYLGLIAKENARLTRLIENFLTFSRFDGKRMRLHVNEAAPSELADEAVAALNGRLHDSQCVFERECPADLPSLYVDRDAIVTVLLNLLENALKFTGDKKHVWLRISAQTTHVQFDVEDNGLGLSKADARRVFDRFYQADSSLARNHDGCGLGLSLVRSIVEAHSGSVEVASTLGRGSTFTVRLPTNDSTKESE